MILSEKNIKWTVMDWIEFLKLYKLNHMHIYINMHIYVVIYSLSLNGVPFTWQTHRAMDIEQSKTNSVPASVEFIAQYTWKKAW